MAGGHVLQGTLPRSGTRANADGKEEHIILVQAERGLTNSLAKPKVSNAKSEALGPFQPTTLRDQNDPSMVRTLMEFGEGAAEVRRLGDDGPGTGQPTKRLEGVAAMKQSRLERHESAVQAWEQERDRVVNEVLALETTKLVASFRGKIHDSDLKIAQIIDPFAPDVIRGAYNSTLSIVLDETSDGKAETLGDGEKEKAADEKEYASPEERATAKAEAKERAARAERDALADGILATMDASTLINAWETIRVEFPDRTHRIDLLENALADLSSKCSNELATTFARVVDALVAVAHLPRPEVERFAVTETGNLNLQFLDDKKATNELCRRLRAREVLSESKRRDAWVAATNRWRELRVEKAIAEFEGFAGDKAVSDPESVKAAYRALQEDQRAAHAALVQHCEKITSEFSAVVDGDANTMDTITEKQPPSVEQVLRWREGLDVRLNAWDAAGAEDLKTLEEANAGVDDGINQALIECANAVDAARSATFEVFDFEFERVRAVEEVERERGRLGVEAETADAADKANETTGEGEEGEGEDGENNGGPPLPLYMSSSLVDDLCAPKAAAITASMRASLTRAKYAVTEKSKAWRKETTNLAAFVETAVRLRETHRTLARQNTVNAEQSLVDLRDESIAADASREQAFEVARSCIAQCQTEVDLDEATNETLRKLDDIETGYRTYWREATETAQNLPSRVRNHFNAYERRVCRLLRLVHNARREIAVQEGVAGDDVEGAEEGEGETAQLDAQPDAEPDALGDPSDAAQTDSKEEPVDPAIKEWNAEDELEEWVIEQELEETEAAKEAEGSADGEGGAEGEGEAEGETEVPADAPADEATDDTPKPPPRERVATRSGNNSFAVWSDLVDFVVNPPELDENGEPVTSDNSNETNENETPTPPPVPLFDAELSVSERVSVPLLLTVRHALLCDYESHFSAEWGHASNRSYEETEFKREELEQKLLQHRPRYGQVEENDCGARRKFLRERKNAFDRYLLSAARCAKMADERFAVSMIACEMKCDKLTQAVNDIKYLLGAAASVAALGIREKECERSVDLATTEFEVLCSALREKADKNYQYVLAQTAQCRKQQGLPKALFAEPVVEEGEETQEGDEEQAETKMEETPLAEPAAEPEASEQPSDEEKEETTKEATKDNLLKTVSQPSMETSEITQRYVPVPGDDRYARLTAVDAAARKSFTENLASIKELKVKIFEKLNEAKDQFATAVPHHKQDLQLLDVVRRATEKAKFDVEKIHTEDAMSKSALDAFANYFDKVGRGRRKSRDPVSHDLDTTFEKVLEKIKTFRVALLKRCHVLEIVPDELVLDHGDLKIELDDPVAEIERAPDEEGEPAETSPAESEPAEGEPTEPENLADSTRVASILETARATITTAGETYYSEKDQERVSTRPDRLPETEGGVEALLDTEKETFDTLENDSAEKRDTAAAEFRFFIAGLGERLEKALETTLIRELEQGLCSVADAARVAAAVTAPAARAVSSCRSDHKDQMRPGIAHSGRAKELTALLTSERTRATNASQMIDTESKNVMSATHDAAARWARRLRRATKLAATLVSGVVVHFDARVDGPGAEAEQAARRKNLKELRRERLKVQAAETADRRDVSVRPNVKERSWPALAISEISPQSIPGYKAFDVNEALPKVGPESCTDSTEGTDAAASEPGTTDHAEDTGGTENPEAASDSEASQEIWAADVHAVRCLMDARDKCWQDFTQAIRDSYVRHGLATQRRVQDETAHRTVWSELVSRAKEGRAR